MSVNRVVSIDAQLHEYRLEIGALKRQLREGASGALHASLERTAEELRGQRQLTRVLKTHLEAHVGKINGPGGAALATNSPANTRRALQLIESTVAAFRGSTPRGANGATPASAQVARWRDASRRTRTPASATPAATTGGGGTSSDAEGEEGDDTHPLLRTPLARSVIASAKQMGGTVHDVRVSKSGAIRIKISHKADVAGVAAESAAKRVAKRMAGRAAKRGGQAQAQARRTAAASVPLRPPPSHESDPDSSDAESGSTSAGARRRADARVAPQHKHHAAVDATHHNHDHGATSDVSTDPPGECWKVTVITPCHANPHLTVFF